jgi:Beta protein
MLQGVSYVPFLHLRMAEMRGLRELPHVSKRNLLPIIRIRPWLTSKSLDRAFDIAREAVGSSRYGLDLDRFKLDASDTRPAYREFSELFDQEGGYLNYYRKVQEDDEIIPVVRAERNGTIEQIDVQLDHIESIGRGAFVRIEVESSANYLEFVERASARRAENLVFFFDCGWDPGVLGQAARCVGLVNSLLDITVSYEIVVSGSSFPDSFTGVGEQSDLPIYERALFQEVRRQVNRGELFYGDWGSTRKPREPTPALNTPRIDMASTSHWPVWRSVDGETYREVAQRVIADPQWDNDPDLWGEYLIQSTAEGVDPMIKSLTTAAAVRINLHLSMQANFDNPGALDLGDEPVGDDL